MTRRSSDGLAIDDPAVAAAVCFLRDRAHGPIQVADVLDEVPVSRRSLERRVRAALGRGIREEIDRAHMERGKALLTVTDGTLSDVARLAGFSDQRQRSVAFRQATGPTPTVVSSARSRDG